MNNFLFITDFDGTVTAQDFFTQILYRYKPEELFVKNNKRGFELLSSVLDNLNLSENEILNEIKLAAMDPNFSNFVNFVKGMGGEVLVLSAGAHYYVKNKLKMENVPDVKIIANESFYENGSIKLIKNEDNKFYDELFGINKLKIVEHFRTKYEILAYAGDSYVDFDACRLCDFKFAKKKLAEILDSFYIKHTKFTNFLEIKTFLQNNLK